MEQLIIGVFEQGFIYAVMALGVYITYKYWTFRICLWTVPFH